MSRWRNNGGWNKRCGTVEKTPRIDSYEAGAVAGWGHLFGFADKGMSLTLECEHFVDYGPETDREIVELYHPKEGWSQTLELSRKANGFGGSQPFFLCPACGGAGAVFVPDWGRVPVPKMLQTELSEPAGHPLGQYDKGMALAEKHLEPPPFPVDGFGFCR